MKISVRGALLEEGMRGGMRDIYIYILEWTRALNAREVSCRRLKWPRPSWIRQTFCTFVEPCREAAPFRSIHFSPLLSSCRASPGPILSYLVLASVALVFSCLGFSCLRLLWSPLVVSPVVLSALVLVPACSLGFFPALVPGRSWQLLAGLGPPLGRPGALWAAPGRPLRRSWRLPGGSWNPLGGSKVAFCRKAEFRRQYSVFHGFCCTRKCLEGVGRAV